MLRHTLHRLGHPFSELLLMSADPMSGIVCEGKHAADEDTPSGPQKSEEHESVIEQKQLVSTITSDLELRKVWAERPETFGSQAESRIFTKNLADIGSKVARLGDVSVCFYLLRNFRMRERIL